MMNRPPTHPIFDAFKTVAQRRAGHPAVIYLGTSFSYRRLADLSERFAAAMTDLGVSAGRKVILYIPNSIQWVVAWMGIQRAGGVCVPITPIYTPHDLQYIANDCGADAVICADTNFGYVRNVLDQTPIRQVIIARMADLLPWWKRGFGYLFDVVPRGAVNYDRNNHSFRKLLRYRPIETASPVAARPSSGAADSRSPRRATVRLKSFTPAALPCIPRASPSPRIFF